MSMGSRIIYGKEDSGNHYGGNMRVESCQFAAIFLSFSVSILLVLDNNYHGSIEIAIKFQHTLWLLLKQMTLYLGYLRSDVYLEF